MSRPPAQSLTAKPHCILVDQSGARYMNEGGSYELYCQTMLERNKTVPAVPSWAIFDRHYAALYQVAGAYIDKRCRRPGSTRAISTRPKRSRRWPRASGRSGDI